jgi:hypothetical protein
MSATTSFLGYPHHNPWYQRVRALASDIIQIGRAAGHVGLSGHRRSLSDPSDPGRRDVCGRRLPVLRQESDTASTGAARAEPFNSTQPPGRATGQAQSILQGFLTLRPSLTPYSTGAAQFHWRGCPQRRAGRRSERRDPPVARRRRGGGVCAGCSGLCPCTMCWHRSAWGVVSGICMGRGCRSGEKGVAIRLPPQVRHGTLLDMPLRGLGLDNFYLRLHIAVTSWG